MRKSELRCGKTSPPSSPLNHRDFTPPSPPRLRYACLRCRGMKSTTHAKSQSFFWGDEFWGPFCAGTTQIGKLCWYPQIGKLCWYPQIGKLCWYPQIGNLCWYLHAKKLLQKCAILNKAINMHSRGPTEQYLYVWEPHRGCCL